jgi:hypothetical protein
MPKHARDASGSEADDYDTGDGISFLDDHSAAPDVSCPMCHIDAVIVPHESSVAGNNEALRQIMNLTLAMSGSKPDAIIYERVAEEFNRVCLKQMVRNGHQCEEWTPAMVANHMQRHVPLVPRMMLQKYVGIMDNVISRAHDAYCLEGIRTAAGDPDMDDDDESEDDFGDGKKKKRKPAAKKGPAKPNHTGTIFNGIKIQMALLSSYRSCVADDVKATGADTLWTATLNDAEVDNGAEQIMLAMYANQSTAGANDRPAAVKLFDAT